MRITVIILAGFLVGISSLLFATEFQCPVGKEVIASLGDGVTMRTCMWEREPNVVIRAGPLELSKNGILILKTQTNLDGKLHGKFTSWSDTGEILITGSYVAGLKEGPWMETDDNGYRNTVHYSKGSPVEPQ